MTHSHLAETRRRDLRDVAAAKPPAVLEDVVRVPDADETTRSVDHAGQVLDEILYRDSADTAEEVDRTEQLTRWNSDDQEAATEYETAGWDDADD